MSDLINLANSYRLDHSKLPAHIAIVMDGNGRWASRRLMPRILGHRKGAESVTRTVETATELGIQALTLFAFSDDNWKRPLTEVKALWSLLESYLRKERDRLMRMNIRLNVIGQLHKLPESTRNVLNAVVEELNSNSGMQLTLALSYGGRNEIVSAAHKLAKAYASGKITDADFTAETFSNQLFTANLPDVDLFIRTSGELRVSNFMLWQAAYAEYVFLPVMWPEFSAEDFIQAIVEFQKRERRFGAVAASSGPNISEHSSKPSSASSMMSLTPAVN